MTLMSGDTFAQVSATCAITAKRDMVFAEQG